MNGRLAGKTALITAAGQGIGHAAAIAMAREGASVFATDVNEKLLERFAGAPGITAASSTCSTTRRSRSSSASCRRSTSCSTARATCTTARSSTATPKDWDFSFNLNVRAMYMTIRARAAEDARAVPEDRRGVSIINMASIAVDQGPAEPLRLRRVARPR